MDDETIRRSNETLQELLKIIAQRNARKAYAEVLLLRHLSLDNCAYNRFSKGLVSCANASYHDESQYDVDSGGVLWMAEDHVYNETDVVVHVFPADNQQQMHSYDIFEYDDGEIISQCHCQYKMEISNDKKHVVVVHNLPDEKPTPPIKTIRHLKTVKS